MQIKTTMRYHYTTVRMAKIKNNDSIKCWWGCGEASTFINCWWGCKIGTAILKNSLIVPYKIKHVITVQPSSISPRAVKTCLHENLYTDWLSIATLFVMAKSRNNPDVTQWMVKQTVVIHIMECYSEWKIMEYWYAKQLQGIMLINKNQSLKDYKLFYSIYITFWKWQSYGNEDETGQAGGSYKRHHEGSLWW